MKKLLIVLLLLPVFAFTQAISPVTVKDFKTAFGKWTGILTYLDYSSGKPYIMPANISVTINQQNARQLIFAIEYPNEPKANGNDTLSIAMMTEKLIDGNMVVSKTKSQKAA